MTATTETVPNNPGTRVLRSECDLCGTPVLSRSASQPRRYCETCRDFRKYTRALERIVSGERYKGGPAAQAIRVRLMRLVNQVPRDYHDERDELGRFRS